MAAALDPQTLIFVITVLLLCRAASMLYAWYLARQYEPVRYWALGTVCNAIGAMLVGLGELGGPWATILPGQAILILGWVTIDVGVLTAARLRVPWWAVGCFVALSWALLGLGFVFFPLLAAHTLVFTNVSAMLFDAYTIVVILRPGRSVSAQVKGLAFLLCAIDVSAGIQVHYILEHGSVSIFEPAWQLTQFYLVAVVSVVISVAQFVLLGVQHLQERLAQELAERTQTANALQQALERAERFRQALDHVPVHVYMKDLQSRFTYVNQPLLEALGCSAQEVVGSDESRYLAPEVARQLVQANARVFSGQDVHQEITIADASGRDRIFLDVQTPVYADPAHTQIAGLCGIATDITPLKHHARELERVAHFDALTQLPNRLLLADRLQRALTRSQRQQHGLVVAFLDLDGFKAINDAHGHEVGDALLVGVTQRMLAVLRQGDTLARQGGDEFIAVVADLEHTADGLQVLERLLQAAAEPIGVQGLALRVSASIGYTLYPQDSVDADLLMRHADQAMYRAKKAGKNRICAYQPAIDGA